MPPKSKPPKSYNQRRKQTIRFLTQDETRRLFKVIKKLRDRALFLTAYRHGLRASEVTLLHRTDLDLKSGRISIQRLKGSISGVYPLQPDLLKLLRRYLRSREDSSPALFISNRLVPIDRTTLWRLMQKYGSAAMLPLEKMKFLCLRHSIATHLLDAGADVAFVRDWLGHSNIQNTMVYAQLTTATRDQAARTLFTSPQVIELNLNADHEEKNNIQRRLQALVAYPREDLNSELKGWLDLSAGRDKANIAKALLAIANHGGGYIVLGFKEVDNAWIPDEAARADRF